MNVLKLLKSESGAALLMAIMFSMIINGIALTLFATSSNESVSSTSQVISADCFNVADAAINIGMLRIKALMEANDPIDAGKPFATPPFELAPEGGVADDTLDITEYRYFDLVTLDKLEASFVTQINNDFVNIEQQAYRSSIDGFFRPETSNSDEFNTFVTGAEPTYSNLIDVGDSTLLRAWRVYLRNDNDGDDKTALLVAVGYLYDPANNFLFQKKIELGVYIHGVDRGKSPDPTGQVTSSETGAKTGSFRVSFDLNQPVDSYDLR